VTKRINQTAPPRFTTQYSDRTQCIPWTSADILPEWGNAQNFAYPLQVANDAMQMDVHKMLHPFYPISLCWLNLNSQSFVWNIFCTSASRNAYLFI